MNKVVMYRRARKANRAEGATDRTRSGTILVAQEEADRMGAARASLVALSEGAVPLDPERVPPRAGPGELDRLHDALHGVTAESHPRTAKLLRSGMRKPAQKVIEEAGEVALEAVNHDARGVVKESADLLYHLVVLWRRAGIDPADVWAEMGRRADAYGIAEKVPKARQREALDSQTDL